MCKLSLTDWWALDVQTQHQLVQIYEIRHEVREGLAMTSPETPNG